MMFDIPGFKATVAYLSVDIIIFVACPVLRFYILRHERRSKAFLTSDLLYFLFLAQAFSSWVMVTYQTVDEHKQRDPKNGHSNDDELVIYYLQDSGAHLKVYWVNALLYNTTLWAIKGCFLALYWSLYSRVSRTWRYALYIAVAFTASTCLINFSLYASWCHPSWNDWEKLENCRPAVMNQQIVSTQYATNIITQAMIMLLPIGLASSFRLSSSEKVGLCLITACGTMCVAVSSIRYGIMRSLIANPSSRAEYIRFQQILDTAELTVSSLAFCLPAFRHIFSQSTWISVKRASSSTEDLPATAADGTTTADGARKELALEINVTREFEVVVSPAQQSEMYALGIRGMRYNREPSYYPGSDELGSVCNSTRGP